MKQGEKIYINTDVAIYQFFSLQFIFLAIFEFAMFTLDRRYSFADIGLVAPEEVSLGNAH